MVSIGEKAPDFNLKNQNDEEIKLDDLKGHWSIVYFYPKDDTPGCTLEAKNFSEKIDEFSKHDIKVIGISPDSTTSHKKFEDKHNLSITLLSDEQRNTVKDYEVWKTKKKIN